MLAFLVTLSIVAKSPIFRSSFILFLVEITISKENNKEINIGFNFIILLL
jgi:hypothetical protein